MGSMTRFMSPETVSVRLVRQATRRPIPENADAPMRITMNRAIMEPWIGTPKPSQQAFRPSWVVDVTIAFRGRDDDQRRVAIEQALPAGVGIVGFDLESVALKLLAERLPIGRLGRSIL